jgi:hypothetical protein
MTLSSSTQEYLLEAEGCLRNALHWSAKNEKPFVSSAISEMICRIDSLIKTDALMDQIENHMKGNGEDKGSWGTFFR